MTPLNLIHYAKCFFALEYFSKDSPSLLLKAEIVTFACLSYYVTCHMKIYQSNFRDFFVFLGILLDFSPLIPTPTHSSGYHTCFFSPIPTLSHLSGYHACFLPPIPIPSHFSGYYACFSPPIPILSHFSGYHACFFLSYAHYVYLVVKNCLRTNNSPSKKLGLLFQLFGIFSKKLNIQTSQLPISHSYP